MIKSDLRSELMSIYKTVNMSTIMRDVREVKMSVDFIEYVLSGGLRDSYDYIRVCGLITSHKL
jgi:hypothetical protein